MRRSARNLLPYANEIPRPWRYEVVSLARAELGHRDQNGTKIVRGRGGVTLDQIMRTFDQLPKAVRISKIHPTTGLRIGPRSPYAWATPKPTSSNG